MTAARMITRHLSPLSTPLVLLTSLHSTSPAHKSLALLACKL